MIDHGLCSESSDISTNIHEQEDMQIRTKFVESTLTRFGGEQDVDSFDEHIVDVCLGSGTGSDDSHIEGSQDVGCFAGARSNVGSASSPSTLRR